VARASGRTARAGLPDSHLSELVKVAFASGTRELNPQLVDRLADIYPELPLYVVSEFAPHRGTWIPYHPYRTWRDNRDACNAALAGKKIRLAAVLLVPNMPYRRMRLLALLLSVRGFLAYNENLDSFMLRPRSLPGILRHIRWRVANLFRWHFRAGKPPMDWQKLLASWAGLWLRNNNPPAVQPPKPAPSGISVVIPSRNGLPLLEALLPALIEQQPDEVIVVDNGSDDRSTESIPGIVVERSEAALSFAQAVNRGIARARYSHILLLNNDMLVQPGFLKELSTAFDQVPDLFCATAQIFFPEGQRREETGKAVWKRENPTDFPVRCDLPIPGENLSYVLYGSGGCSLFDAAKLRALSGLNEIYQPAYVEDLDLGYRAWLQQWPSVFVAPAMVEHRHRATMSRYHSPEAIDAMVQRNYLKFAASTGSQPIWRDAIARSSQDAWKLPFTVPVSGTLSDETFSLCSGDVAVFPGRAKRGLPVVLIATAYLPFPLAHGGAVRIFNLVARAAPDFDQLMVAFCDELTTPPTELLELCVEIVMVKRKGTHYRIATERPDMVEELDSPAYHGALKQMVKKWNPAIAQLEFTPMAQYAPDCRPAKTILVEHDITFDLHEQLVKTNPSWEAEHQLAKWQTFERGAWPQVDRVVTMSSKDAKVVGLPGASCLPNGVDLQRFQPQLGREEPGRVLFIGSFTHLPNLLALEFFVNEIWPKLDDLKPTLHVIAGARHEYYLDFYRKRIDAPRMELEGFVSDVRSAYARAGVVIAPLTASAGTNIKILEAMAMGKAIVSTPAGINGLDVSEGVLVERDAAHFAKALRTCLTDRTERERLAKRARMIVERDYGWDEIGRKQSTLYQELIRG
jgi:GT2 family glycosyltransferase/glycosyltransferase involved in cell wall biosynthesis